MEGLEAREKTKKKIKEKEEGGKSRRRKIYMSYWASKDRNIRAAQEHHTEMLKKYPDEIQASISRTICYGGDEKTPERIAGVPNRHTAVFWDKETNNAVIDARDDYPDKKIAVLNFASYQNPGGKYLEGSSAQEETLCHASTLYECLEAQPGYYEYNKNHKNYSLYTDRALYVPDVVFETDDGDRVSADVITCASPNRRAYARYFSTQFPDFDKRNREALISRISFIRDIAEENKVDVLILGAFGCGVFGQDQDETAAIFQAVFNDTSVPHLLYAVPSKFSEKNAEAFQNICEED